MEGYTPRSCLDYLQHGIHQNGFYLLYDYHDEIYVVFCDLSNEPGSAWTLVMSWLTTKYKELPHFKSKAFYEDAPVNEETPNLEIYRQSLKQMNSIREYSTHWRATCDLGSADNYTAIFSYKDYLRGTFSDFNIMLYEGGRFSTCQPVDYINILGNISRSGSTVGFWQSSGSYLLNIDSSDTGCDFRPSVYPRLPRVDYFGYYGNGLHPEFTCSRNAFSTTQWWFGGYVEQHSTSLEE